MLIQHRTRKVASLGSGAAGRECVSGKDRQGAEEREAPLGLVRL